MMLRSLASPPWNIHFPMTNSSMEIQNFDELHLGHNMISLRNTSQPRTNEIKERILSRNYRKVISLSLFVRSFNTNHAKYALRIEKAD